MPNLQVLPPVVNPEDGTDIEKDAPKKFTNVDSEPFEFTWDGRPFGGMFPERMSASKLEFTNSDGKPASKTQYEFLKGIEPGETVTMPKYLVNYAAMHLARKIYKRQAFASFQGTELEKKNASIQFVNPAEEWKLMELMVAENFPGKEKPEVTMPTAETVVDSTQVTPKSELLSCDKCEFIAKSEAGLKAHQRKHK